MERENLNMTIAEKIRNARTRCGYTQEQAAELLLVSRVTISNWETGKTLPDIATILAMSEVYDLTLDELLKGDAVMTKKLKQDARASAMIRKIIRFAWCSIGAGVLLLILHAMFSDSAIVAFLLGALPWILFGWMLIWIVLFLTAG